jgi:hypothetical protein
MSNIPTEKGDLGSGRAAPRTNSDRRRQAAGSLGYVAVSSSASDRRATEERVRDLTERVQYFTESCIDARDSIAALEQRRDALPQHARGSPLEIVAALAMITIVLEYVPARLFTQIFVYASDNVRLLLTVTFTVIGAVAAIFLGELLHRLRVPERQRAIDTSFLVLVLLVTIVFLYIGYSMRVAYTAAAETGPGAASVEAVALTSVAAVGIIVTVVSAYYRESLESFKVRWTLARLQRDLRTSETYLKTNKRDLMRATTAVRGVPVPDARATEDSAPNETSST